MSGNTDKRVSETTVQTVAQNLTTIQSTQCVQNVQSVQNVQNIQSVVQSNVQNIQPTPIQPTIVGTVVTSNSLMGKSVSLDMNPKLSLMKPVVASATSSTETSKIATTVRVIC